MNKIILIIFLLISNITFSQKYISISPSLFTNSGDFKGSICPRVEIGKKWDVYSLGLSFGKMNLSKQSNVDTTNFLEIRNTLNVFKQGKFSNNIIIGAGYVINSNTNFISELTTNIEYVSNNRISYTIHIGTYYYKGNYYGYSNNFFGTSIIYYLK